MRRRPLESLGGLVREKRGKRTLRDAAKEIGVGPATLLRVESGRVPDVATFGKICVWLSVDPGEFLGSPSPNETGASSHGMVEVSAHFRADQTPQPETLGALAQMILLASRMQPTSNHDAE